ncbi:MAG: transcription antitermination factor NusB [Azoarcus sp.]|jgi:N utilization substance protein B|nr:transcription antitermination factor NusB [Azoarcus sp.]
MSRETRREIAARRRARELALQGIYQWLLHEVPDGKNTGEDETRAARLSLPEQPAEIQLLGIEELLINAPPKNDAAPKSDSPQKKKNRPRTPADADFFAALLQGAVREASELRTALEPMLSRPVAELSPVEHAILLLGAFELRHDIETPYRVVINEAIELAKKYGGTDGHKFVNGVLDRLAVKLRPQETTAPRTRNA